MSPRYTLLLVFGFKCAHSLAHLPAHALFPCPLASLCFRLPFSFSFSHPTTTEVDVNAIRYAIKEHFERVLSDLDHGTRRVGKSKYAKETNKVDVDAVHFGFSNGHEISLLEHRGSIIRKLEHQEGFKLDHGANLHDKHNNVLDKKITALKKKLGKITDQVDKLDM